MIKTIKPDVDLFLDGDVDYQNIEQNATLMTYTIPDEKIQAEKDKYEDITEWSDSENNNSGYFVYEKKFLIPCKDELGDGGVRDTLVKVKEYYLYPRKSNPTTYKVKDVFNLDNDNRVYIKFKNIPRKLKGIDPIYTLYTYDYNGNLGLSNTPSPGGFVPNNFCVWQCFGFNDDQPQLDGDPFYGKQIEPPDFFKAQNEMIFRAFFGSVDGVEQKNTHIASSKEAWEWIPYEYFNRPIIEP